MSLAEWGPGVEMSSYFRVILLYDIQFAQHKYHE